jgi:glutamate-ammonia-ligase adenylyltransferase
VDPRLEPSASRSGEDAPADTAAAGVLVALSESADPDLALRQLHRIEEAARRSHRDGPLATMRTDAGVRGALAAVLGASVTLGDDLVVDPERWQAIRALAFDARDPFNGARVDSPAALRTAHRTALLRIAAADLTGACDVDTAMLRLSLLADATLAAGVRLAQESAGAEPHLAVIAMGKCGGRELNYVSDVDVIFVCESDADLADAQVVAARMMQICGQAAWQVDANLRPEGSQGPLVRTLAAHIAYYQKWARTWEFQALLKARPAAGDLALGERWQEAVSPLVWQAAERPEAVEDVRAMRRRIIDNVPAAEREREIKRGPGGLRDIEFAVQLLQLVHGRGDEHLRSGSTLEALAALTERGYVGRTDGVALGQAYRFLRTVEHRLQLQRLRRTHTVPDGRTPEGAAGLRWLAHALGYRGDAVESFRAEWITHAQEVRRLHSKLVYRPLVEAVARVPGEGLRLTPQAAQSRLEILGFTDPAGALRHLEALTSGVSRYAAIQNTLLPVLLNELADAPEPDRGLLGYRQVSDALRSTPWFLRLLRDEGAVTQRLARLLGMSRYVTDLLVRDPEALRLLADDAELVPRPLESLVDGFGAAVDRHGYQGSRGWRGGAGAAVQAARALRRRELFRIACADLLGLVTDSTPAPGEGAPVGDRVLAVGQALSDVTDATLAAALKAAVGRTKTDELPFAIIGMGRLGGAEMSYASDADVLFVYEPLPGQAEDAASGLAHGIAEELRRLLSAPSPEPPLGVDADLRPEGRQGPLVRSLAAYERYYAAWSKTWEAQALLRARFVAGDASLGARFLALADRVRYPEAGLTAEQVTEIRRIKARVDTERLPRGADPATHAKLGRGGLADVEWAVQLLQLRHAHEVPGLRTPRTLDALTAARDAGFVSNMDAVFLARGWVMASQVRNALMLVRGRASDQLPRQGMELMGVARALGRPSSVTAGEFLDEYLRTARRARGAAERVFLDAP